MRYSPPPPNWHTKWMRNKKFSHFFPSKFFHLRCAFRFSHCPTWFIPYVFGLLFSSHSIFVKRLIFQMPSTIHKPTAHRAIEFARHDESFHFSMGKSAFDEHIGTEPHRHTTTACDHAHAYLVCSPGKKNCETQNVTLQMRSKTSYHTNRSSRCRQWAIRMKNTRKTFLRFLLLLLRVLWQAENNFTFSLCCCCCVPFLLCRYFGLKRKCDRETNFICHIHAKFLRLFRSMFYSVHNAYGHVCVCVCWGGTWVRVYQPLATGSASFGLTATEVQFINERKA